MHKKINVIWGTLFLCMFFSVVVAPEMVEDSSLLPQRSAHTHENNYRSIFEHEKPLIHNSFTLHEKPLIANVRDSSFGAGNRRSVEPTPTDLDFMHAAFKPTRTIEFDKPIFKDMSRSNTDVSMDHGLSFSETQISDGQFDAGSHDETHEELPIVVPGEHGSGATALDEVSVDLYQRKIDALLGNWNKDVTELRRNLMSTEAWQDFYDTDEPIFISDLTKTFYLEHDDAKKLADATLQYVEQALKDKVSEVQIMANIKEMYSIMFGVKNIPADSSHLQNVFEIMKQSFIETLPGIIRADIREEHYSALLKDVSINASERERLSSAQNVEKFADAVHTVVVRNFVDNIVAKVLSPLWDKQGVSADQATQLNQLLQKHLSQSSDVNEVDAKMNILSAYLDVSDIASLQDPEKLQVTPELAEALKQYELHAWTKLVEQKLVSLNIPEKEASVLRQKIQDTVDLELNGHKDPQAVLQIIQSLLREINELNEDSVKEFEDSLLEVEKPTQQGTALSMVPTVLHHVSSEIAGLRRTETGLTVSPSETLTSTERTENIQEAQKALTLIEHLQKTLDHINPFTPQEERAMSAQQRALNLLTVGLKVAAVGGAIYGLYTGHLTGEISSSGNLGVVYTH